MSPRDICNTCYKEIPQLSKLEKHELSHSDNKSFRCQVCQRSFAQASQLKSHLHVHTGERPFKCQRCVKSFDHNVSLKNLVTRYHQGESGEGGRCESGGAGDSGTMNLRRRSV
ncbi:gastrula zinc finger protein XlCGF49.1-like [Oncorhynchus clarkii lewisi]|uniref:gastrula zinc finger protein XlCGF49.1-like n=1 Tax=Oncorhynchus clarkii lewisi TaxID=490388 RepID=UPI0039B899B2